MLDPQDWITLLCFEAVVLWVSRFADQLKNHAAYADHRRDLVEKLYQMSRNILMLDRKDAVGIQIVTLIRDVFNLHGVSLWDARGAHLDSVGENLILGYGGSFWSQRHFCSKIPLSAYIPDWEATLSPCRHGCCGTEIDR